MPRLIRHLGVCVWELPLHHEGSVFTMASSIYGFKVLTGYLEVVETTEGGASLKKMSRYVFEAIYFPGPFLSSLCCLTTMR